MWDVGFCMSASKLTVNSRLAVCKQTDDWQETDFRILFFLLCISPVYDWSLSPSSHLLILMCTQETMKHYMSEYYQSGIDSCIASDRSAVMHLSLSLFCCPVESIAHTHRVLYCSLGLVFPFSLCFLPLSRLSPSQLLSRWPLSSPYCLRLLSYLALTAVRLLLTKEVQCRVLRTKGKEHCISIVIFLLFSPLFHTPPHSLLFANTILSSVF